MRRDVTVTRRTPSQTLLYFVSILMAVLAGLILARRRRPRGDGPREQPTSRPAWAAWSSAQRRCWESPPGSAYVQPATTPRRAPTAHLLHRSLLILLVIIAGWSNLGRSIFDPVVLAATVIYVLVCSSPADEVERTTPSASRVTPRARRDPAPPPLHGHGAPCSRRGGPARRASHLAARRQRHRPQRCRMGVHPRRGSASQSPQAPPGRRAPRHVRGQPPAAHRPLPRGLDRGPRARGCMGPCCSSCTATSPSVSCP